MTYEEKLDVIVKILAEERRLTRIGHVTKANFSLNENYTRVEFDDIRKILLKLQDDEHVLKIMEAPQPFDDFITLEKSDDDYKKVKHFDIELTEEFDAWFENYLLQQKTKLENLDYLNMLRIYDVVLDINEQLQLENDTTVVIHLIPSLIRYQALFPADTPGLRNAYSSNRLGGLKYLKDKGVIDGFAHGRNGWDTLITVTLKLSKFDDFYRSIMAEYVKRNKSDKKVDEVKIPAEAVLPTSTIRAFYDPKTGVLSIQDKRVRFKKESFRAKLLELLLKNDKNRKKEWSWDEAVEEIQGIIDSEGLDVNKNKFYPACDGLSKFIAQKTGINDFLVYNKSTVQICQKYV